MTNKVTLTIAGETSDVEQSFDRVGGAAKRMDDKVGSTAKGLEEHAGGLGKVGEAADVSERNLIGVHDVIDGTATIMKGPGKQGVVAYIQGWADLAGGLAPIILGLAETKLATIAQAAAGKAAALGMKVWAAAQWLMNASLWGCPVLLIVAGVIALVAVIVLIATKTNWFQKAWSAAWGWIKSAASNTWDFIKKIPGWIGSAFSKIASVLTWPFRTAFNTIADAWNNTIGRLSWSVPSWVPFIGGNNISVPNLPHFHAGGIVPGPAGRTVVAALQGGEEVSTTARGRGDGGWITVRGDGLIDQLTELIAKRVGARGGRGALLGIKVV